MVKKGVCWCAVGYSFSFAYRHLMFIFSPLWILSLAVCKRRYTRTSSLSHCYHPPVMTQPGMDPANVPLTLIIWITAPYNLFVAKSISERQYISSNFGNHLPDDNMKSVGSIRYERWIDQHLERRGHDLVQGTLPETEVDDENDTVALCFLSASFLCPCVLAGPKI